MARAVIAREHPPAQMGDNFQTQTNVLLLLAYAPDPERAKIEANAVIRNIECKYRGEHLPEVASSRESLQVGPHECVDAIGSCRIYQRIDIALALAEVVSERVEGDIEADVATEAETIDAFADLGE